MKFTLGLSAVLLCAAALAIAAGQNGADEGPNAVAKSAQGRFVVHEWGTFTSFSGSDSVKLEFRPLVDVDLPPFVLDRGRQLGIPNPFMKLDLNALQRMETPVTYFYTDRPRQVNVRVGFPHGLLTEFFPPVEKMQPEFKWGKPEPLTGALLDWGKIWIIPENRLQANVEDGKLAAQLQMHMLRSLLPKAYGNEHYKYPRETDSALVYVERQADKQHPVAPHGGYFEKFLFYRGIGNFDLPLKLTAYAGGGFELGNLGSVPIRSLFLVTVEGERIRFAKYDKIGAGERLRMVQSENASSVDQLAEAVVSALIGEHLYEKEARAMVKTWRTSWFGEQGTRLFYVLPQTTTQELLPLTIEPSPNELVRVMIGRLEIMRPEDEARITEIVKTSLRNRAAAAKKGADKHEPASYALPQAIIQLGRLAEPALVRVKNVSNDVAVRYEADLLLGRLREYRNSMAKSVSTSSGVGQ